MRKYDKHILSSFVLLLSMLYWGFSTLVLLWNVLLEMAGILSPGQQRAAFEHEYLVMTHAEAVVNTQLFS